MEAFSAFATSVAARPDEFFAPNEQLADRIKAQLKFLVDHALASKTSGLPGSSLSELYVEGFDAEQIWAQLQMSLADEPRTTALAKLVDRLEKSVRAAKAAASSSSDEKDDSTDDDEAGDEEVNDDYDESDSDGAGSTGSGDAMRRAGKSHARAAAAADDDGNDDDDDDEEGDGGAEGSDDDDEDGGSSDDDGSVASGVSGVSLSSMEDFLREGDEYEARLRHLKAGTKGKGADADADAGSSSSKAKGKGKRKGKGKGKGGDDSDDASTDADDDEFGLGLGIDLNAPLPDGDDDAAGAGAGAGSSSSSSGKRGKKGKGSASGSSGLSGDKAARLAALLAAGPRYEDMYGPRDAGKGKGKGSSQRGGKVEAKPAKDKRSAGSDSDADEHGDDEHLDDDASDGSGAGAEDGAADGGSVGSEVSGDSYIDAGLGVKLPGKGKAAKGKGKRRGGDDDDYDDDDDESGSDDDGEAGDDDDDASEPAAKRKRGVRFADGDDDADADAGAGGADDDGGSEEELPYHQKYGLLGLKAAFADDGAAGAGEAQQLTRHQREKAALASRIAELEDAAVGEKAWLLRGEVEGGARPANSLLASNLEIEQAVKLAPEATPAASAALEELIKQRIADAAFDDPAPRDPSALGAADGKGDGKDKVDLSSEKSTLGLGDLYAEAYAAAQLGAKKDDPVAKAEAAVGAELAALFSKLDALTAYTYTPKPPTREMVIAAGKAGTGAGTAFVGGADAAAAAAAATGVAALAMEEVLPGGVSAGAATAAHEAYATAAAKVAAVTAAASAVGAGALAKAKRRGGASADDAPQYEAPAGSGKAVPSALRGGDGKVGHGVLVSSGEMSAAERRARRRAGKEAQRAAGGGAGRFGAAGGAAGGAGRSAEKRASDNLARAGVKVGAGVAIGGGVGAKRPRPSSAIIPGGVEGGFTGRFGSSANFFGQLQDTVAAGKGAGKGKGKSGSAGAAAGAGAASSARLKM